MSDKPLIHFAHANGIPSKSYSKLFELLSSEYDVIYIPLLSAHKGYEIDNHWQSQAKQVIYSIKSQAQGRKVIGLGHSLGALSTFLATYEAPHLFSKMIMMDPPMIMGRSSFIFHMAKLFSEKTVEKLTPIAKSKNRRNHWDSKQDAYDQLRNKALFRNFDETCFRDYIENGLIDHPEGGVTLTVPVSSEVEIFRTNPSLFWLPMQKPKVPVHQLSGSESQFIDHGFPSILKNKTGIDYTVTKGSHMFPLEHPEQTVEKVKAIIEALH